ncbi:MAG: DUF4058 family protein [Isosphaeraceae bacterium]
MDSPFPGIDPYIEAQGFWPDFHARLLTYLCDRLNDHLPGLYAARMEEEIRLVQPDDEKRIRADIAVLEEDRPRRPREPRGGGVAVLEPVLVPVGSEDPIEVRDRWIEVVRLPERKLVTVIEMLSPSNKFSPGREEYLTKRRGLIERKVHVVEIDVLLGGRRLPLGKALPPGDGSVVVIRAGRDMAEVYAWPLSRTLPRIPIPLAEPDPDIPIDLAPLFQDGYRKGLYGRLLRYEEPYSLAVADDLRGWIEATARAGR